MSIPDLTRYSLALYKGDRQLFVSIEEKLKPLVECVFRYRGKIEGCLLYDKVVGLAAAKLIVYSGMVSRVVTPLASQPAIDELDRNDIDHDVFSVQENILGDDGVSICLMEQRALKQPDNEKFFEEMKNLMGFSAK
jgi:hypothetical protein